DSISIGGNYDVVEGENTTIYNQSDKNLKKLNWTVIEDVFFEDHIRFYEEVEDLWFEGSLVDYNSDYQYEHFYIEDTRNTFENPIEVLCNSLYSGKSVVRPNKTIRVGANVEGWGAVIHGNGKTAYFLKQIVIRN